MSFYGRFDVSWTGNGAADKRRRLRDWLDPINSGVTVLDGRKDIVSSLVVGEKSIETNTNKAYYNAEKQTIIINEDSQNQSSTIELFDLQGKTIMKETTTENFFNIAYLQNGIYVCRILQNGKIIFSEKIMKR